MSKDLLLFDLSYEIDPDEIIVAATRLAQEIRNTRTAYNEHIEDLHAQLSDLRAMRDTDQHAPIFAALTKYLHTEDESHLYRAAQLWDDLGMRHYRDLRETVE